MQLERLLALEALERLLIRRIRNATIKDTSLVFNLDEGLSTKPYKIDIASLLQGTLESTYYNYLAGRMLTEGYTYTAVEGGEIVESPRGDIYQIHGTDCSCPQRGYCKHLILRDWHLTYRARQNDLRHRVKPK
jgi:hypothetical protein